MSTAAKQATKFSWIPIYAELAQKVIGYRNQQTKLIQILKELQKKGLPAPSTVDSDNKTLAEIDPFTFFASFNRNVTDENRRAIVAFMKEKFDLKSDVPTDFSGIPTVMAQATWFFAYKEKRKTDDISNLWTLAEAVVKGAAQTLDSKLFEKCLAIMQVGAAKLSMGMFWLNPKEYIALDKNNLALFKTKGITQEVKTLSDYLQLLNSVNKAFVGMAYPEVSRTAWGGEKIGVKQYWAGGIEWRHEEETENKRDEFVSGNYWQLGWSRDDDNPKAQKAWVYFDEIRTGDEFAIKGFGGQNDLTVYYVGEVLEKHDADGRLELRSRDCPLYKGKAPKLEEGTWFTALSPVKGNSAIELIFAKKQVVKETSGPTATKAVNLILYGPPGTGKTFQTVRRSVETIDSQAPDDREVQRTRFDELINEGRIEFITFHQSYSYEDFIEGIRPTLDEDGEGDTARYECRPGIFKKLATNALFECLERIDTEKEVITFDALWKSLLARIEAEPDAKYQGLTEKTSYQLSITERGNIEGRNVLSDKETKFLCSRKILEEVFEARRSEETVNVSDVMEVVKRGCHSQFVAALFNELRRMEKSKSPEIIARKKAMPEEDKAAVVQRFLADGKKSGYGLKKPAAERKKFVLVIDEINRGNISKILGELITLIEDDKRYGEENQLVITLPYSGERFAVPPNLYLLGTMNTADKSIALVDLALRRRFEFEEIGVDLSICGGLTERMRAALEELNKRILLRKDRDHQLGHAYFVGVSNEVTFETRFRRKVIPLLQEYFYSDWDGLRYILGEKQGAGTFIRPVEGSDIKEARTKWRWFSPDEVLSCLESLCANYGIA